MKVRVVALAMAAILTAGVGLRSEDKEKSDSWQPLFNGKDTTGWHLRATKIHHTKLVDEAGKVIPGAKKSRIDGRNVIVDAKGKEIKGAKAVTEDAENSSGWTVEHETLVCSKPHHGNDLVTDKKFTDFELHVEFQATSNSGVYLQGRYEIQIDNSFGQKPSKHSCGAIYGRIAPSKNMAKKPKEWQTYDVIFHGARGKDGKVTEKARVTLIWNGEKVIDNGEIDGPTGAALDGKVLEPGPILLQGDHGRVAFRNVKIRPLTGKEDTEPLGERQASCPPSGSQHGGDKPRRSPAEPFRRPFSFHRNPIRCAAGPSAIAGRGLPVRGGPLRHATEGVSCSRSPSHAAKILIAPSKRIGVRCASCLDSSWIVRERFTFSFGGPTYVDPVGRSTAVLRRHLATQLSPDRRLRRRPDARRHAARQRRRRRPQLQQVGHHDLSAGRSVAHGHV
jgi:hypothetical protein